MVNLSSNNSNNINLSGQTQRNVNVSTPNTNNVDANTMGNSQRARSWAIGEGLIDGEDYSAKHYAQLAKVSEDIASGAIANIEEIEQQALDSITTGIGEIETAKEGALSLIDTTKDDAIDDIDTAKSNALIDIETSATNKITLINNTASSFEADLTLLTQRAETAATSAESSAINANSSATSADTSATAAATSATNASNSESNAQDSATAAATSASNANQSAISASNSASNAATSASSASTSATNAATSETNASNSAIAAATSEDNAEIWAEGTDEQVQALGGVHSSKGWSEISASGQINSDWAETDITSKAYILNKPTNYVTTDTAQNISGRKTFLGEKAIYFKQNTTTDKLGFTLYNPSNTELGALEWRPNTINGNALLALNCPQSGSNYVGFRYWSNINIVAPRPTTNGNYFIPVNITDGTNTVTANNNGTLNISSLLPDLTDYALLTDIPTVNNGTLTIQKNGTTVGTFTANDTNNITANISVPTSISDLTDDTATYPIDKAESVVDNNSGSLTFWSGTKAQYDAIATKDANTLYNITDDSNPTLSMLELLYPVGSIYIGTMSACPLQTLGVGTWQLVATDRVLQGAGTRGSVGNTLNESLPNITGSFRVVGSNSATSWASNMSGQSGAFYPIVVTTGTQSYATAVTNTNANTNDTGFNASRSSSTYQNNAPVQQDAYLVNIWERIS